MTKSTTQIDPLLRLAADRRMPMTKRSAELQRASEAYRDAQGALAEIMASHEAQRERAKLVEAQLQDMRTQCTRLAEAKALAVNDFASGRATANELARAREALEQANKAKAEIGELGVACEKLLAAQPAELARVQERCSNSRQAFWQAAYAEIRRTEAPANLSQWLSRLLVAQRAGFGRADFKGLMVQVLADSGIEWVDTLPIPGQADTQRQIEEAFLD